MTAPRSELKWIGMDLDGTLFHNNWSADNPTAGMGEPIEENIFKACQLVLAGYKLVIHTARPWADHELIVAALKRERLPFEAVVCGKLLAAAYVDDRAIHDSHPDWVAAVKEING